MSIGQVIGRIGIAAQQGDGEMANEETPERVTKPRHGHISGLLEHQARSHSGRASAPPHGPNAVPALKGRPSSASFHFLSVPGNIFNVTINTNRTTSQTRSESFHGDGVHERYFIANHKL
jgi:hypothetical protein